MTLLCGVIAVIERILADDGVISDALGRATKLFKAELDLASSFTSIQLPEEVPQASQNIHSHEGLATQNGGARDFDIVKHKSSIIYYFINPGVTV